MKLTDNQLDLILHVLASADAMPEQASDEVIKERRKISRRYRELKGNIDFTTAAHLAARDWLKDHLANLKEEPGLSPLQQKYADACAKYPGSIVLMKVGDFYEVSGEDAKTVANTLNIALFKRANVPTACIPEHSIAQWSNKLQDAGLRVAVIR